MDTNNLIINSLVSIAIPAYKVEFLSMAIDSVLNQTYNNIELIIVNDASPFDIDTLVDQYSDSRIRYFKNETNLGKQSIVLNWNKCLSFAKGEFFVLLCDDDILMPNFISELLELTIKYPDCNVFHARKYNLYPNGHKEESPVWPEYEDGEVFLKNSLKKLRHHTVTEFMYRTSSLIRNEGYIILPVGFYSDRATIMVLSQKGGIVSSEKCLVKFRYSDNHITSSRDPFYCLEKVKASLAYWEWIHNLKPWVKEYDQQIKEDIQSTVFSSFIYSSLIQKFKILCIVPDYIISLKLKIGYIWAWLSYS